MTDSTGAEPQGNWTTLDEDPRDKLPTPHSELEVLLQYLEMHRLTLEMKAADLNPEQLATASVPPSPLTLLGLFRHMAQFEHNWVVRRLEGSSEEALYSRDGDMEWDFSGIEPTQECVDDARAVFRAQAERTNAYFKGRALDEVYTHYGETVQLRQVLVHMVETYARHMGHADLIRERIDGRTGV